MPVIRIIPKEEFKTTPWSGGATTELFIWPEGASYQERRFSVRISSASVDIDESTFTHLPGVKRFLTPLCPGFELTVNGREVPLPYGEVLEFSGDDEVACRGRGRDLNLMLKGAKGEMRYVNGSFTAPEGCMTFVYAPGDLPISFCDGSACTGSFLCTGSFASLEPGEYHAGGDAVLFIAERTAAES